MKYKYSHKDTFKKNKFGINLAIFDTAIQTNQIAFVDVEVGHLEEFYNDKSTFMYLVLEGKGTFVLNDEKIEVSPKDLIVAPPNTKIHYFGKMKLILCTTPKWEEVHEHHVRMVDASESPYHNEDKNGS